MKAQLQGYSKGRNTILCLVTALNLLCVNAYIVLTWYKLLMLFMRCVVFLQNCPGLFSHTHTPPSWLSDETSLKCYITHCQPFTTADLGLDSLDLRDHHLPHYTDAT